MGHVSWHILVLCAPVPIDGCGHIEYCVLNRVWWKTPAQTVSLA